MSPIPKQTRRRTILINPRLQAGTALVFGGVLLLAGALFAWFVYRDSREALWTASIRGHFGFDTPYRIVGDRVVRQLILLYATLSASSTLIFLLLIRRIRAGMTRLREVLRISGDGDLSSPSNAPGLREIGMFGRQLDAVRSDTLDRIREIREEVEILRAGSLPPGEFQERWDRVKERIGRIGR